MNFASEPERDDGGLPPVNIVIPDDARELDRDLLAYHRELRARRRRERFLRLLRPFGWTRFGGHAAMVPLLAACLALTLIGAAMLSVATISPAAAPTLSPLPAGSVKLLDGAVKPVRSLKSSAVALVPPDCGCGADLRRLADQASKAHAALYFVGTGTAVAQIPSLTARYGAGAAVGATDVDGVLGATYHPVGLTVLLVFRDASAEVQRNLGSDFQLGPALSTLRS